ncbi:hypothetical protein ACFSVJ_24180 [Prauserella oleivorans]
MSVRRSPMSQPTILSTSPGKVILPVYHTITDIPEHELHILDPRSPEELRARIADADFVLGDWTGEMRLDRAALQSARRCRLIVQPTAGYDSIDVEAARELGIPVVNTPGANSAASPNGPSWRCCCSSRTRWSITSAPAAASGGWRRRPRRACTT